MHGSFAMNRRGRKRKTRVRTPSGALVRIRTDYRAMAAAQPHRNWLPEALRESEKAGTVIGCLNLIKRITDDQFEAGRRYSVIVGAYRAVAGVPGHLEGGGKGYGCAGNLDCEPCLCRQRTDTYMRAYEAISRSGGRKAHMAINRAVIFNEPVTEDQLDHLRRGLDALRAHFGMDGKRVVG